MPHAGKWNKHVDAWDCLKDQEFFSLEGFAFVMRQMAQVSKPPNRITPEFNIMKKYKEWEIRRWVGLLKSSSMHCIFSMLQNKLRRLVCLLSVRRHRAAIVGPVVLPFRRVATHRGCPRCCRYKPYVAAQVAGKPEAEAEVLLREYLAGANEGRRELELTTPLLHASDGALSFMVPGIQVSCWTPYNPVCIYGLL